MAVPTEPRQPVVYDMMLLADAIACLIPLEHIGQRHGDFCERQKNLETALTKIRNLAQFMSGTGKTCIKVTDPPFSSTADKSFINDGLVNSVSKYVSHLEVNRFKKNDVPPPTAKDARVAGMKVLKALTRLFERQRSELKEDAAYWYGVFEESYQQLLAVHSSDGATDASNVR